MLPDIFNCSNFEYNAFSSSKVDSRRRIRKKKKSKKKEKRKIVFKLGSTNIPKRKAVDSVLKNHKPFFIHIGNYRVTSVQNHPLFAHFWPVKFWSRDWALPNLVCIKHPHCVQISAVRVKWFWNYKGNNLSSQKLPFFLCFFVSQFTIT